MTEIAGFKKAAPHAHGDGTTSVDEGQGYLFASDRTVLAWRSWIPPRARSSPAWRWRASPDYVRYVAATHEVWVTEPDKEGIEIFSLSEAEPPVPAHKAFLAIPGGPESLVIDNAPRWPTPTSGRAPPW